MGPYIVDWSRDLFDGRPASESSFAVPLEGSLHAVTFDGMSEDEAKAARGSIADHEPEMMWLPVAGLDRHTPCIGLRPLPDRAPSRPLVHARAERIQEAIYRPISICARRRDQSA
jgi:hypothetical protein